MRETSPMRKYSLSGITGSEALLPLRCFFFSAVMTEALRAPDGRLQHWHSTIGSPALHGARTCTLVARTLTRNNSGVGGVSRTGSTVELGLFRGWISDHASVSAPRRSQACCCCGSPPELFAAVSPAQNGLREQQPRRPACCQKISEAKASLDYVISSFSWRAFSLLSWLPLNLPPYGPSPLE